MVVYKLESFAESIPEVMVQVNLKELIQRGLADGGKRPTIVVDSSSFSFLFFDDSNVKFNGQPAIFKAKLTNFLERIISCGANLIVVLRGFREKDENAWFFKQKAEFQKEVVSVRNLKKKEVSNGFVKGPSGICVSRVYALFSNEHYKVFTAIKRTHIEVAKVAVKTKCLAVIGQDSNYLIYEGIGYYISARSINTETLDCQMFDRSKLLERLGLNSDQLPMFATLCGNDVVPHISLRQFHRRISVPRTTPPPSVSVSVARILNNAPLYCRDSKYFLGVIAAPEVTESLIRQSLDMYFKFEENNPAHEDNVLVTFANGMTRECHWSKALFGIFRDSTLYDSRFTGIVDKNLSCFELLRPLRKKLYSTLFQGSTHCVREYFIEEMLAHGLGEIILKHTDVQFPNCEHPGLVKLYLNRTPEMNLTRWKLFLTSVSKTLSVSTVQAVPERLVLPVLALHYLDVTSLSYFPDKKIFKKRFEVETFLIAALLVARFPTERLENVEETEPDLWVYQLTVLYQDVCYVLDLLNQACGFVISREKSCICNFYDGKLINFIYRKLRNGSQPVDFFEDNAVLEVLFNTLMEIVQTTE